MRRKVVKRAIIAAADLLGAEITLTPIRSEYPSNGVKLVNIGSGDWKCRGWICLDHSSEWYKIDHKNVDYVEYDIRHDKLPFADNSVDAIYCSHVIEHIEDNYVEKMLLECYRVLKIGGIVRIACPDAKFLWNVTKCGKNYWIWRKEWCKKFGFDYEEMRPIDFLVRELATKKFIDYQKGIISDYEKAFDECTMDEFLEYISKGEVFDENNVGNHINYWTYDKIEKILIHSGFNRVIESKYAGSICPYMKNKTYFDSTFPEMSVYVEAIKE